MISNILLFLLDKFIVQRRKDRVAHSTGRRMETIHHQRDHRGSHELLLHQVKNQHII